VPALAGCDGTPEAETTVAIDGAVYATVEDLTGAADVVVVGVVGEQLEGPSVGTAAYHRFAVDDVIAGDAVPDEVLVWLDLTEATSLDPVRPLVEGSRLVVFADRVLADEVDEELPAPSVLSPLMYDNGTLDVDGQTVTARSSRMVDDLGTLDDLRAAVAER